MIQLCMTEKNITKGDASEGEKITQEKKNWHGKYRCFENVEILLVFNYN